MTRRRSLTDAQADELRSLLEIRRAVAQEYSDKRLTERFGVSHRTLRDYGSRVHKTPNP